MLPHLRALRERIHAEVCERGFNPRVGAFTQSYGSDALDASVLVIPHVGFLPGSDPRVQGTVAAIEKELLRDGFVLRYGTEHGTDGLPGTEGAFLACSFWLADNYAFAGRHRRGGGAVRAAARRCATTSACSPRSTSPTLQRQIGNFPQAFSHLALIFTAQIIESRRSAAPLQRARARIRHAADVSLTSVGAAQNRLVTARNVILSLVSRRRAASVRTKFHSSS